jgi:DNA (cytosine-5)-methyltransferase 1
MADTTGRGWNDTPPQEPGEHQGEWQRPTGGRGSFVADSESVCRQREPGRSQSIRLLPDNETSENRRSEGKERSGDCRCWSPEPAICRVAPRLSNHVDRLRALGNAVVPQIPEILGRMIMEAEAQGCS